VNAPDDPRIQETATRVEAWFVDADWNTEHLSQPYLAWGFKATNRNGTVILVSQRTDRHDLIVIEAILAIAERNQHRLTQLPKRERVELLWEVQLQLMQMGVLYDGINDPLQRVTVLQQVHYDGLTKDTLFQRVFQVVSGMFAVDVMIARKFIDPLPAQSSSPSVH